MNEPIAPTPRRDNGRAAIVATTIVLLTCILSCAGVLITLILKATW
jgi:hypothetical protein